MEIASISQTKNRLSALIDKVRHGETVLIMDRDRPVARLEPVTPANHADPKGRLLQLERNGVIRRMPVKPAGVIIDQRPPKPVAGGSLLKALLADREEGR
jgi:prevent-host-death family protein